MFDFIKNWTKRILEEIDKLEVDLNNDSDKTDYTLVDCNSYDRGYERGLIAGKICGIRIAVESFNEETKQIELIQIKENN